ncbi:very short patch repair endonuclease [Sphingomonas sp. IC-56]|nr:very short patch repair endonuclease [Sphingomonas sp. IC-56]
MRQIRARDTGPELIVRRALHARGLRFRLHRRDLPGTPDIVLPGRRLIVFVHGCFWHRHAGCRGCTTPSTRREFWQNKFDANVARDVRAAESLTATGWRVETIWECEARDPNSLSRRLDAIIVDP